MTGKARLAATLKAYSDKQAALIQESLFRAMELQQKVTEIFDDITGWLEGIDGLTVERVDGGPQPFMATVFHTKHLKINLAKRSVQFNPIVSESDLAFSIVGLVDRDLRMDTAFLVTSDAQPVVTLDADTFCNQLAHMVERAG
ncbi:hypothetical protein [Pseudomonas soli]|uniref:hypothetical protein n=1 Tax=Pseudomonas soli TaxID=1306993 RepID=UPI00299D25B9|nr:hypothetical protein [Pseudomonas soli]MDW9405626.1 hypothetical protein [Pseudomonas soli]